MQGWYDFTVNKIHLFARAGIKATIIMKQTQQLVNKYNISNKQANVEPGLDLLQSSAIHFFLLINYWSANICVNWFTQNIKLI